MLKFRHMISSRIPNHVGRRSYRSLLERFLQICLPLHRAVSGLHFHGSERQLVATLEALIQLGADVTSKDQAGNTVLHKALQICTSKSVTTVVHSLLTRGVPVHARNKEGDNALHTECRRYECFL